MSSSATGVGMPICFLWAILLILTQKSSQKFGDVLGIGNAKMRTSYQPSGGSGSRQRSSRESGAIQYCPISILRSSWTVENTPPRRRAIAAKTKPRCRSTLAEYARHSLISRMRDFFVPMAQL